MRNVAVAVVVVLGSVSIRAQAPPAFEVASVTPNDSGASNSSTSGNAASFTAINVSLRQLIVFAYRMKDFQVGAPSWTESERYDISARSPEGATGDNRGRLQTLLAERFKLTVHRETREQPIYALVLARNDGRLGPQLKTSTIDCKAAATAKEGQPDATTVAAAGPDAPSLFTALQEQLGLKLDAERGPVEFLVVDRVERPTPD